MTIMDRLNTDFESVFKSFADGKASSGENVAAALPQPPTAATVNSAYPLPSLAGGLSVGLSGIPAQERPLTNLKSALVPATGSGSATAPDLTDPPVAVAAINSDIARRS